MLMGRRQGADAGNDEKKFALLAELNAPVDVAQSILRYLHELGTIFEQMGSWSQLQGSEQLIFTRSGGRQGCRLGAMIFNLIYAAALVLSLIHISEPTRH
eukprot:8681627-Karenia_brevis.AAC.1